MASPRTGGRARSSAQAAELILDVGRLGVLIGALVLVLTVRAVAAPSAGAVDLTAMSADQIKEGAATRLEAATGPLGSGYSFDIVQTSTMKARAGGPLIQIPDPENGRQIIGEAEEYPYYTLLERGVVRPEGFWSELRSWPVPAGPPEFDKAELRRSALVRAGVGWRNDRLGWYRAEVLPGIGLDPATAKLLPTLLRDSEGAIKVGDVVVDGSTLLRVDASADKRDFPGVVAADGLAYTKLIGAVEFGFDGLGRLARIHAVAQNTNLDEFDLVVDTVITINYDFVGGLPQPEPTWDPTSVKPEGE